MGFKVIKDGKEILVRDTPENRQKAKEQGLTAYDELISPRGERVHVSENLSAKAIREKGYMTPEGYDSYQQALSNAYNKNDISPLETAVSTAANTMSWGLGPVVGGATQAIKRGALMSDDPWSQIKRGVEAEGLLQQQREIANPGTALASGLATGIATPGLAVKGVKGLGALAAGTVTGALEGGISSGISQLSDPFEKSPEERLQEVGFSTLLGMGLGLGGGIAAKAPEAIRGVKGIFSKTKKGTEGLEEAILKEDKDLTKAGRTSAPEDLSARDLARIADEEKIDKKPVGFFRGLIPEQIGRYITVLEDMTARKHGVSRAKQILTDLQKIIKEDKKIFLSEIQDNLEKKIFNGRNLDDLTADEVSNLDPNLIVNIQNQLQKIENDINQYSAQDYVTARLRMPTKETTPLQKYVSEMSVGGEGGYGEAVKQYQDALKLGPQRRGEAQALEFDQAGEELWPYFQKAEENLSAGIEQTMDDLTQQAKQSYRFLNVGLEDIDPTLRDEIMAFNEVIAQRQNALEGMKSPARYREAKALQQEISDLESRRLTLLNKAKKQVTQRSQEYVESGKQWFKKISNIQQSLRSLQEKRGSKSLSNAEKALNEGLSYVDSGGGPVEYGFSNKLFTDPNLDDSERFSRLWKMRQILDDNINYVKREKKGAISDDERFLIQARAVIKDELRRYSKAFENSDRIYSMFKNIQKRIFGHTKKPLDRYDLSDMIKNTKQAKKYRGYLNDLRELAVEPLISENYRKEIQAFLDNFDKLRLLAKDKETVAAWEKVFGPTGQGVQKLAADSKRLSTAMGQSSSIGTLFGDPNTFLKIDQNFAPKTPFITGKPSIKGLDTDELLALTRTNNKYQKALTSKTSITDERLKTFYDDELARIREKSSPPPSGGDINFPKDPDVGLGIQGSSLNDRIKSAIIRYATSKGTSFLLNEGAKAAGSESGINVFEPYKEELKQYMVDQGIPEKAADIALKLLPDNPLELGQMLPRIGKMDMGDVIKFPGEYNEPKTKAQIARISRAKNDRLVKEAENDLISAESKRLWPYKDYPNTPYRKQEMNALTSRNVKLLQGGEPLDYETFAKQIELGTAKQSVFDTFNPNFSDRQKELEKFRMFQEQIQNIDRISELEALKKEFEKGGKYEKIKNRMVYHKIIDKIKRANRILQEGSRESKYINLNNLDEMALNSPFDPFIPLEMQKSELDKKGKHKKK